MSSKPSNPKDAVGIKKAYTSVIPWGVIYELGLAMLEGALKYGRHNYRDVGIRASTYFDAADRHMKSWWEGEDIDPDSGISHVTKAIASLTVLRDGMMTGLWEDDRPPALPKGWLAEINAKAAALVEKYPNPAKAIIAKKPSTRQAMLEAYQQIEDDRVAHIKEPVSRDPKFRTPCQSCHLANDNPVFEGIGRCTGCPRKQSRNQ